MPEAAKTKNVLCQDCDQEVKLTQNEETKDWEGRCGNCGLNVGRVLATARVKRAVEKQIENDKKAAAPKPKEKKKDEFGFEIEDD